MSGTYTNSNTNTFTEARARYVLGKMKDDFINMAYRGFTTITTDKILGWWEDVAFSAQNQAFNRCQLKFVWGGSERAITYKVVNDGSIYLDSDSAGFNFHQIPETATVHIILDVDLTNNIVYGQLKRHGWIDGGNFLTGNAQSAGGYSQGGYGFDISTIGF